MGVPPATVTASLGVRLIATTWPAARAPLPGVVAMAVMVGAVVSICRVPAGLPMAPAKEAALPASVRDGGAIQGRPGDGEVGGVLAGLDRIVENQVRGGGMHGVVKWRCRRR